MYKHKHLSSEAQAHQTQARLVADLCFIFLKPLLSKLNQSLDRRLVHTFLETILVLIIHRHRNLGLVLSELGGYLATPSHAPAGTKRLSRLLRSTRWQSSVVEQFLWDIAGERVDEVQADGSTPLLIWDESVLEKPESLHLEGLGPVRSAKAARLKRIKPGFFNPPGGRPIFVPGFNWLMVTVLGRSGPPTLASLKWWTTRGERATDRRSVETAMMAETSRRWGQVVIHVWDRGFAGGPWLTMAFTHAARFVMRWPKHLRLVDEQLRERKAWQITRGKRSWGKRLIYDARRRCQRKVGIIAVPVFDPQHGQPLTLVVARPGRGQEPWYLLTNEPVRSEEEAWRVVFAYARRWQVETMFRYSKSELAFESIRVQRWEPRQKLLLMATLAQAFLLTLLRPCYLPLTKRLLRDWCHRTGKRSRETPTPLYRLRAALSLLLLTHPPPLLLL
jgi:hypothetical protein